MSDASTEAVTSGPALADAARERLVVALDFATAQQALSFVDRVRSHCRWVKVGMELFYAEGAALISELRARDLQVFLDLKLYDIPNTVAAAVRSLARLDVQLLTVHASGGPEMLRAAQAATEQADGPELLGVTVLTSIDGHQLTATGVTAAPPEQVLRLGRLAASAGLRGLVCSPLEASALRRELAPGTALVTPGIRPRGSDQGDQKRVATPLEAIRDGASLLVVGRPITRSAQPEAAMAQILSEIETALKEAGTRSAARDRVP